MTSTHYDSLIGYLQFSRGTFTLSVRKFSALFNNSVGKCCLHSFCYIFLFTFTAAPASLTVVRKWTDYSRNESSREHSLPGTKVPGNFRSWEQRFPLGTFAPRSEKSWYRAHKRFRRFFDCWQFLIEILRKLWRYVATKWELSSPSERAIPSEKRGSWFGIWI